MAEWERHSFAYPDGGSYFVKKEQGYTLELIPSTMWIWKIYAPHQYWGGYGEEMRGDAENTREEAEKALYAAFKAILDKRDNET